MMKIKFLSVLFDSRCMYDLYDSLWSNRKRHPLYNCSNFVYSQPIFIIFGRYRPTLEEFTRREFIVSPPNTWWRFALLVSW